MLTSLGEEMHNDEMWDFGEMEECDDISYGAQSAVWGKVVIRHVGWGKYSVYERGEKVGWGKRIGRRWRYQQEGRKAFGDDLFDAMREWHGIRKLPRDSFPGRAELEELKSRYRELKAREVFHSMCDVINPCSEECV